MKPFKPFLLTLIPLAVLASAFVPCAADGPAVKPREPNFLVDVSAGLVSALIAGPVDRTEPVHEIIQDTPICGISRSIGSIRTELVPDSARGMVDVVLQSCVHARTVGTRQTILIHTVSTTPIEIRRRIVINEKGIQLFAGPGSAVSSSELIDITSTMDTDCLTMRLARRGYENAKCAGEVEGACKTLKHAAVRLDGELMPPLASASSALGRELAAFERTGLALEALSFSTTAARLQGQARFSTPKRKEPIPVTLPPDFDLAIRVHESVATEAAQTEFGGRSFPVSGVSGIYAELTRGLILDDRKKSAQVADLKTIEKLLADLAGMPITINLPMVDPLIVKFADQGFAVEAHVASIRKEKIDYAGLRIKAAYRLINASDGVHAVRSGKVEFIPNEPQPGQKLAELPKEFRVLLETLFGEFMKERLVLGPLPMPEEIASKLQPPRAYARNGWFALVWKLRPSETRPRF